MFTLRIHFVLAVCLVAIGIAGLSSGQQFTDNSVNEQEQQDFDYEEPAQTPTRFQTKPQPSASRGGRPAQPTTPRAPPVQILKQINRHNEDGSYTYGFEGSDGSFKIETKLANGEVKGKYGYVDDSGKVRVVEYGANRYGFQPAGEGITVAPPTLVDETKQKKKKVPAGSRFSGPSPLQIALNIPNAAENSAPVTEEDNEYDEPQDSADQQQAQPQFQPQQQSQPQFQQQQFPSRNAPRIVVQARARPVARPAVVAPVPSIPFERPSANFEFGTNTNSGSFQEQQSFGRSASAPASPSSGPVPPRAQVAGAAPAAPVSGQLGVPSRQRAAQPRPAPQFLFQEAPQARQATRPTARQFAAASSSSSFDELEKLYALPSGGSNPTHDFSFGAAF